MIQRSLKLKNKFNMSKLLYVLPILFLGVLPSLRPLPASAASSVSTPHVLLSEINWAGSGLSNSDEWLELYNQGSTAVDLSGWVITGVATKGEAISFAENTHIDAGGTLLISNFDLESTRTTLNVVPSMATSALSLANTNATIMLAMPDGTVVDEVSYSSPEFGSSSPKASMERNLLDLSWRTSSISLGLNDQSQLGTPGYITLTADSDTSNCVPTTVTPKFEFVMTNLYEHTKTAAQGDNLTENPIVDQPENVSNASEGTNGNGADLSETGTAVHQVITVVGADNESQSNDLQSDVIPKANSGVDSVSGVLTALPGTFGDQIAFVQGIELYFNHADWPDLSLGDELSVQGVFSESRGEQRIKIAEASAISVTGHSDLQPTVVTIAEAQNVVPGTLVQIEGDILEKDGDKLRVSDATGELTVVAQSKTNISWSALTESQVRIVGVMRHLDGEIKLYPRSMQDISSVSIVTPDETATELHTGCPPISPGIIKSASAGPWLGSGLVASSLGALAYWYAKKRKEEGFSLNPLTA